MEVNGICAIGITTHPHHFINGDVADCMTLMPFATQGIGTCCCWANNQILINKWSENVEHDVIVNDIDEFIGNGDNVIIYVESNIFHVRNRNGTVYKQKIQENDDQNYYYFAMVFTVNENMKVHYEISDDF